MKKISLLFLLFTTIIACEKEETPKDPPPATPDAVDLNLKIDNIRPTSVTISGEIEYTGDTPKELGILWSQKDEEEEHTLNLSPDGNTFSTTLTGLKPNTSYGIKAYAKQKDKTFYSAARSIKTESGVFEGGVELNTQEEIEEFGAKEYIEITGKLTINENTDQAITSLEPLHHLQKVSSFTIGNFSVLKSLAGLDQLTSTGSVYIHDSPNLEDISALEGITSNVMFLYIHNNANLKSLQGLENISFAQQVEIKYNGSLTSLEGLEGLQEVHDLILQRNTGLISLEGLEIKKAQEVHIWLNPDLITISALSTLENTSILTIHENPMLTSLEGLEGLTSIDGYFSIFDNPLITNMDAFSTIEKGNLGAAIVDSNRNLSDFCGAQHLFVAIGEGNYSIDRNKFNPSFEDLKNGNCKL